MQTYSVTAHRIDDHEAEARAGDAHVRLDTGVAGRRKGFNPAELLLASLAACMLKGIERVTPILKFELRGVTISLTGTRQDVPPKMLAIEYVITVDSAESDQRLDLLHRNILKYGTISNTLGAALDLHGRLERRPANAT